MSPVSTKIERPRLVWIDWMKVLGIYFIVAGHFFPHGCKVFYTFSVPLFFVISGFLTKDRTERFYADLTRKLLVPMAVFSLLNVLRLYVVPDLSAGRFDLSQTLLLLGRGVVGFQSTLGVCWFVYTLALLKIIHRYTPRRLALYVLLPLSIAGTLVLKYSHISLANAAVDTVVTYPFWLIRHFE